MNSTPSTAQPRRALVLGGGGSSGNAWLIGLIAGLVETGVDVTAADLTVGTSAGSTTAAQLAGATPSELLAATLGAVDRQGRGPAASDRASTAAGPVADHLERTTRIIAAAANPADMRRQMGLAALELPGSSDDSVQARWRAIVGARLTTPDWPQGPLLITAVEARSGEPVVFDRQSGVELVDAVAASCAGGFAYRIGDHQYIDGGYRTNADNADLAAGHERVLVLSPFSGRNRTPVEWGLHLAMQISELRAHGSRVETVFPERGREGLFGANAMDPSLRAPAARAGYDQGRALAEHLGEFWG